MRCVSWNVNGIRSVQRKNLLPWEVITAEVIGLQETKAQPEQLDPDLREPDGWHAFWHSGEKPGYSGTALICRDRPDEVREGLGEAEYDKEGRVIAVFLMLTGIGVIGIFTATVANYFFESEAGEVELLTARLAAIEQKLDQLLLERRA